MSRTEYNSLLQQTDGEPCEDDVWEYILGCMQIIVLLLGVCFPTVVLILLPFVFREIEHFDVEDGELTRRGFFQIYKRVRILSIAFTKLSCKIRQLTCVFKFLLLKLCNKWCSHTITYFWAKYTVIYFYVNTVLMILFRAWQYLLLIISIYGRW